MRRAVFLDRDGTICADRNYLADPGGVVLLPGAAAALAALQARGFALVVATNQSAVARGLASLEDVRAVNGRLDELLRQEGVCIDAFYVCPHLPEGPVAAFAVRCGCRKPEPGLLRQAAAELGIDLGRSFLVGDQGRDVEAGRRAGCRTVLLRPPGAPAVAGDEWADGCSHVAFSWENAVEWILTRGED